MPDIRLSDKTFAVRHGALRVVLTLQLPLLVVVAAFRDRIDVLLQQPDAGHVHGGALIWVMVAATAACAVAAGLVRSRRSGSLVVSLGLLLGSAALVHAGGGLTDLHFAFFVVLGLISLYQEWLTLVLSVGLVAVHHVLVGFVVPGLVFSDPRAWQHPVVFALLHAVFVLAMCAVQLAYWRFIHRAQVEMAGVQEQAAEQLRQSEERYRALVQDSCDVINVVDRDGVIKSVSPAVHAVMGYRPDELEGTSYYANIHPDDAAGIRAFLAGGAAEQRAEVRTRHADGSWHWHDVTSRDLTGHPAVGGIVVSHRDVTERRQFQDLLQHEAAHDVLTGLANRGAFLKALDHAVDTRVDGRQLAVLFIDLNDFKPINDTLGHEVGDNVLVAVANALQRSVLGSDTVGRLGGDEFAVVLGDIASEDNAIAVATRILGMLAEPVTVGGTTIRCTASIGIALTGPDCAGTDELLSRADAAMYHAKRGRDTGWAVHSDDMTHGASQAALLEHDLREAVEQGQLRVEYQPIVSIHTGDWLGVEALARWTHPTRGPVPPDVFIKAAEQSSLIHEIGHLVLRTACEQLRRWQTLHPHHPALRLNVNLSPRQLKRAELVDDVLAVLADTGIDPRDLTLEVTESALIEHQQAAIQLAALHAHGIKIALDDFGTGYCSLRYLTQLPVDTLKIDRSFVGELNRTGQGSAVTEAVVRLGQAMHLDIVAEGIETGAQAAELTLLGCTTGQGFHFARPMTAAAIEAHLTEAEKLSV
jgi:diguanylate cyclase (GGDEF)-like protein/PAS domain S-box-containing protein